MYILVLRCDRLFMLLLDYKSPFDYPKKFQQPGTDMKTIHSYSGLIKFLVIIILFFTQTESLKALPGYSVNQLIARYKNTEFELDWVDSWYQGYFNSGDLHVNFILPGQRTVTYVELLLENRSNTDIWFPQSNEAYTFIQKVFSTEVANDFKNSQLLYEGPHYSTESIPDLFTGYVLIKEVDAQPIYKLDEVRIYQGKLYGYEFSEGMYLNIYYRSRAEKHKNIMVRNRKMYEEWDKREISETELVAGIIQSHAVYIESTEKQNPDIVYFTYIPENLPKDKIRLVILNHGDGGSGKGLINYWKKTADKVQVVVAAIDQPEPESMAYIILKLRKQLKLKEKAIVMGSSSGGTMTYLFAADRPDLTAAYLVNSATAIGGFFMPEETARDIPALMVCGSKGGYTCDSFKYFVQTAKEMGFKDIEYVRSNKSNSFQDIVERFLRKYK